MTNGQRMVVEIGGRDFEYKIPYLDRIKEVSKLLPSLDEKRPFEPFHGTALMVDYDAILQDIPGKLVPILKAIFANEEDVTEEITRSLDEADVFAVVNGFFSLAQVRTLKFKEGAAHLNSIIDTTWETYRRVVSSLILSSSGSAKETPKESPGLGGT
jgi:hypothetical protein